MMSILSYHLSLIFEIGKKWIEVKHYVTCSIPLANAAVAAVRAGFHRSPRISL